MHVVMYGLLYIRMSRVYVCVSVYDVHCIMHIVHCAMCTPAPAHRVCVRVYTYRLPLYID